jgi:hypothetical protein
MFKGYIKSFISNYLGGIIEDFTDDDFMLDKWNGTMSKENVKIKKGAFDYLFGTVT